MSTQIKKNVVVIGGGPGGLAAAVSAAREGASVLLVERNGYLGGQLGSGLPFLAFWDKKKRRIIGGFAQEFVERMEEAGASFGHEYCPHHLSTTLVNPFYSRILAFQMCREAGVEVLMHCELSGVKVEDGRLTSVTVTGKGEAVELFADVFIDGTGDADLVAMSGAEYEKGDEDGVLQPPTLMFNLGGVNWDRFCDWIAEHPEEIPYDLIHNIEEGYDSEFFRNDKSAIFVGAHKLLKKWQDEGNCPIERDTLILIRQPIPGEVAVNNMRVLDFDGSNIFDLSRGEMESHLKIPGIIKLFRRDLPGFENCYLTSINSGIGVRESRRMKGVKMLCQQDAVDGKRPEDTIALCSYFIDVHSGNNQETYRVSIEEPFGIPYGCLVSKDIENLMVTGRPISVDRMTFGATRIMNVCMAVGQAAGNAAAMCAQGGYAPKDVNVSALRKTLIKQNAILDI